MIAVYGAVNRTFDFPADVQTAFDFYSEFNRIVSWLPGISVLADLGQERFLVGYGATELGIYKIQIECPIQISYDRNRWTLTVSYDPASAQIAPQSGLNWSRGQGRYESVSVFTKKMGTTQIEYSLQISASLKNPLALKLIPGPALNQISRGITHYRIDQIASAFIDRSLQAFQQDRALSGTSKSALHAKD